jgi:hypothetical protein
MLPTDDAEEDRVDGELSTRADESHGELSTRADESRGEC